MERDIRAVDHDEISSLHTYKSTLRLVRMFHRHPRPQKQKRDWRVVSSMIADTARDKLLVKFMRYLDYLVSEIYTPLLIL